MNTHPLSQLIQSIEDGQGWTDREVSRRIAAAGHKMSHSYIGKLKNHPIQSVNASMVQTLAIGLGIPETVVAEAALASMGVHIDTSRSAGLDVAIATDEALTDRDKRLLRSLVKEMRTDGEGRREESSNDDGPRVPGGPQSDGATSRRHLSAVPGSLSRDEREEMYRRAEQVDLSREPFAAADPEDDSDDDESV
ncbi:hypothetical protein [Brachybacterium paraconglomeratum]|uniref:hypothetical protein n=1 Tax=Brachybacterium paraconglomeratum TaxID=173362 RepID=UPI0022DFFA0A|nr:hypothetical protein [Brachybacterium paraconglomeratum]